MARDRRDLLKLAGLFAAGTLSGCVAVPDGGDGPSDPGNVPAAQGGVLQSDRERETPDVDDATRRELVAGDTRFALDLHRALVEEKPDENLFFSPYSVSIALAMTWAGARGTTEREMRETLHYLDQDRTHPAFNALDRAIDGRDEVEVEDDEGTPFSLETANAVWGQEGFPFRQSYLDALATNYGAGLRVVDYESDPGAARDRINEWVAERTEGKIPELFPEGTIDALTRLVLANAVYFQANWEYPFDEAETSDGEFTALDGSTATVPFMHESRGLPYAEGDGWQAVELPYVGGEVSMVVLLPEAGTFEAVEADLTADRIQGVFDALERREGSLAFPKFTYHSGLKLADVLAGMGMPSAFDADDADFHGMYDHEQVGRNLFVGSVVHEGYVAVDENGTEAAAATGVEMRLESAPANPWEMAVDRPFLFAIRDRPTDTVLFLGRVVDAGAAQSS